MQKRHHPDVAPALQNLGFMRRIPILTTLIALGALALGALATTGCQTLANIENPEYLIRSVRPRVSVAIPFSASTVDLDFDIEIRNPNTVGLRLDQIDFDLLINDSRVLTGISNEDVRIPANGTSTVELRTRIGYDNARSILREAIGWIEGNRANYEIRGTVYYDTPLGRMRFPLAVYRRSL